MHFLKTLAPPRPRYPRPPLETCLQGPRVGLRIGDPTDWHAWRTLRELSRAFLTPWEPAWPINALSYGYYCGLLRRHVREWREGEGYNFHVLRRGEGALEGALIGGISLTHIERGISQSGTLGYWMGEPFAGQGFMREAASLVCAFAFETLQLHRLQASCMPANEPSIGLLHRLGFEQEGYAKAYLKIDGLWEDHLLWARVEK